MEIGNPSYNMYEVDHDNHADAGSLLRPNFTLDPHKGWCVKSSDPRALGMNNVPKEVIPGQVNLHSLPVYPQSQRSLESTKCTKSHELLQPSVCKDLPGRAKLPQASHQY